MCENFKKENKRQKRMKIKGAKDNMEWGKENERKKRKKVEK